MGTFSRIAGLRIICLRMALAAGVFSALTTGGFAETQKLVTGDAYPPFTGVDLPGQGLATEIVRNAFREMGQTAEVEFKPWKRGYSDTLAGRYLATFPYGRNAKREKEMVYSEPLYEVRQYLFTSANSGIKFESDEDLHGKRLCLPIGYNLSRFKKEVEQKLIKLVRPPDMESCIKMIKLGRADMVRTNDRIGWALVEKVFGSRENFAMIDRPVRESIEHLIVSRNNEGAEAFIAKFNNSLEILRSKGIIKQLVERHIK